MATEKIRVGLIGANVNRGWGPSAHIPALLALPEYELTAVCTAHKETAEEAANAFGARLAFSDHEELVQHPDIDLVTVSVRVPFHHELTTSALQAGKHVYTEWPLGVTLQETQDMAALARTQGVRTLIGLQGRGSPALIRLKELVAEGYVGEVLACHLSAFGAVGLDRTSDRIWAKDRSSGVGALQIQFGHYMDALCFCVGDITEVSAVVSTQVSQWTFTDVGTTMDVTTPDNVLMSGKLAGGAVVSAHVASIPWHGRGPKIEIYGREGTLVYHGSHISHTKLEGARSTEADMQELPIPERLMWVPSDVPQGPPFNVAQMYRRFAEAIQSGERMEPDFDTAVRRHQLLEAVQTASDQGGRVVLDG
ncbi:Gfo/Idh/MocA family protein [Candidatus Entotheonella palauensis]|uniref:Gfo/Idh/MocA family protein n=1 Tax=Candidatus Entotheonella palauensis TaxID=93172 RepID=UPI000B7F3DF8|nr:Gfo/Idh/MocA family oxidoreductase [Candidatus Entotheonella palauensis]